MSNAYLPQHQQRQSYYDINSRDSYASYSDPYAQPYSHDHFRPLVHETPDDRDDPFDVRADFDGDGPRWSDKYGAKSKALLKDPEGGVDYKRLDSHVAPSGQMQAYGGFSQGGKDVGREELVSVPVLGPEWNKNELHELSRRGQAEVRQEKRTRSWKLFARDQRGLCGVRWLTRRVLVFSFFFFCIALGITLFFLIPRAPTFTFYEPAPFSVDNSTVNFNRVPTNFSFAGNLNLYADTSSSYLPVQFNHLRATVFDLDTLKVVATGDLGKQKIEKGKQVPVLLPVTFAYTALNTSDTTWNAVYDACGHLWTGTVRPDLKFRLELKMDIVGLVSKPFSQTQISNVACPFELPENSV